MDVAQSVVWPPFLDAIKLELTCEASVKNEDEIVAIEWTGVSVHKSVWVEESFIINDLDYVERTIIFQPWLESHAGIYTCYLVIKDKHNSIFMMHKTIEVKGKHLVLDVSLSYVLYTPKLRKMYYA